MNNSAQKRSRGQNHAFRWNSGTITQRNTYHAALFHQEVMDFAFDGRDARVSGQFSQHFRSVNVTVRLSTRPLYSGALAPVQKAKLNTGTVGNTPHHTVQRIDLAHEVPLPQPSDRGIARHNANR